MSFSNTYRIIALAPELVGTLFTQLRAVYGEDLPDGHRTVRTLGAHWDDTLQTRKRAAEFPTTSTGILLTDDRVAFRALWQADLIVEFDANGLPGVAELTDEQLAALVPPHNPPAQDGTVSLIAPPPPE